MKLKLACRFYANESGTEPVREWVKTLPKRVRHEIGTDVAKVQREWPVSRPLVGSLGKGLYEVVTSFDRNEYRVLFCIEGGVMVLLHGFQKKSQKTPQRDLELARERQKETQS